MWAHNHTAIMHIRQWRWRRKANETTMVCVDMRPLMHKIIHVAHILHATADLCARFSWIISYCISRPSFDLCIWVCLFYFVFFSLLLSSSSDSRWIFWSTSIFFDSGPKNTSTQKHKSECGSAMQLVKKKKNEHESKRLTFFSADLSIGITAMLKCSIVFCLWAALKLIITTILIPLRIFLYFCLFWLRIFFSRVFLYSFNH